MKLLKTFNTEKVPEDELAKFRLRRAVRIVLFDKNGKVAVLKFARRGFHSLPGGGVEKTETFEEGCLREGWEETGCKIEILSEIGCIREIWKEHKLVNQSCGFKATVVGKKGDLNLAEDEKDEGIDLLWVDLDEAISLIGNYSKDINLYHKYTHERDVVFLKSVGQEK